jgi:hypothetical protein
MGYFFKELGGCVWKANASKFCHVFWVNTFRYMACGVNSQIVVPVWIILPSVSVLFDDLIHGERHGGFRGKVFNESVVDQLGGQYPDYGHVLDFTAVAAAAVFVEQAGHFLGIEKAGFFEAFL